MRNQQQKQQSTAEQSGALLIALANAVAANEKVQRRFRNAVLIRLSRIETMLVEVQGAQLVDFGAPGKMSDEERAKFIQEVQERVFKRSHDLGVKMFEYIYSEPEETPVRRGRRKKWSNWGI